MRTVTPTRAIRRAEILATLSEEPGLWLDDLTERLNLETSEVAPLLYEMQDEGVVNRDGRRWSLA